MRRSTYAAFALLFLGLAIGWGMGFAVYSRPADWGGLVGDIAFFAVYLALTLLSLRPDRAQARWEAAARRHVATPECHIIGPHDHCEPS